MEAGAGLKTLGAPLGLLYEGFYHMSLANVVEPTIKTDLIALRRFLNIVSVYII
jgi:hypothetical protein